MKDEIQPSISQIQPPLQTPTPVPPSNKRLKKILLILLGLIIITASVFAGIQIGKNQISGQQPSYGQPTALPTQSFINATVTTTPNIIVTPNANWKTYVNSVLKYTISYPADWLIDISEAELPISDENSQKLVIYKGQYKLTILWPAAYGPGICIFDDQSREGASEMATYCEGEYLEFTSNNNKTIHRRLLKSETFSDHQQWEVYTKDKTYFVTVPPTRYSAPLEYRSDQIEIMDSILSSFKSTD